MTRTRRHLSALLAVCVAMLVGYAFQAIAYWRDGAGGLCAIWAAYSALMVANVVHLAIAVWPRRRILRPKRVETYR